MENNSHQGLYDPLKPREIEILSLITDGLTNGEIAQRLHLTLGTVKWYNNQIFSKLGVPNRTRAVKRAKTLKIFEVMDVKSKVAENRVPNNLPAQLTSYVGRVREISEIRNLLISKRLVTLSGAGGSGKTRLALQVASDLLNAYQDGVWLVELANIRDPALVSHAIAKVLNITEQTNKTLLETMKHSFGKRKLLLILDNFEHLLQSSTLVAELLASSPQLAVLATSRECLHIYGEQEYQVDPLPLPDVSAGTPLDQLQKNEAMELFIQRAHAVNPNISLDDEALGYIAKICTKLDGLPLAIELCAPMVKIYPLSVVLERIDENLDAIPDGPRDLPARHKTLLKTLQWSFDLLDQDEKKLFERLAIFNGGGTLDAIMQICADGLSSEVELILSALVNKNLVLAQERKDGDIHFALLETIRQYNLERLNADEEDETINQRHAEYFLQLIQHAEKHLLRPDQSLWLDKIEADHDNFRAALNWCNITEGMAELNLLLASSLELFWGLRGYLLEGREHLSAALSRPGNMNRTLMRADALSAAGHLAYSQGDYPEVRILLEESLSIYQELGSIGDHGRANALITLGDMETEIGSYEAALVKMKEALNIMYKLEDERGISRALWQLGACEVRPGNFESATQYFEEALPLLQRLGDDSYTTIAISGLAEIAIRQGDFDRALTLENESLVMRKKIGEPWGKAVSLGNLGWIALLEGHLERASILFQESLTLRNDIGDKGGIAWCLEKLAEVAIVDGDKKSKPASKADYKKAVRLYGAAEALRDPVGSKIDLVDKPEYERKLSLLREKLEEDTFEELWDAGRNMNVNEVIDYALAGWIEMDG